MEKLNQKQELYAQGLAKGRSQLQAYTEAGYAPSEAAASRMSRNVKVADRVSELQERAVKKTEVTIAGQSRKYDAALAMAVQCRNPSAMVSAITGQNRLHGLDNGPGEGNTTNNILAPIQVNVNFNAGRN